MKIIKKLITFIIFFLLLIPKVFGYTKAPVDITTMSIKELTIALDNGYLTSELLVQLYLDRIEEYNDKYNAILYLNDNALEEAKSLDKLRNEGKLKGNLHGIPIVVKTNIDVKGIPTTAGAKALKDNYPNKDSEVVKQLKDAGAIILGTTNMSEFAFLATNSNSSFGRVRNAYNSNFTPYGSSGGSAVAVAASFASAALGTDTNSSVRAPATANNLVGIRPTIGLISSNGVIPYDVTRDTVGIITKSVYDNALILNNLSNKVENKDIDYLKSYNFAGDLKGIKIGVPNEFLKGSSSSRIKATTLTDDDIYKLMQEALIILESKGADIIYLDNFFTSKQYTWWQDSLAGFTFCDGFNNYIKNTTGSIKNFEALNRSSDKIFNLSGYYSSCNYKKEEINNVYSLRSKFAEHVSSKYKEYNIDVIVYPATKNKTFKIGSDEVLRAPGTFISSVTGFPSITIPLGFIDDLPYGIEFMALEYNESLLYQITSSYTDEKFESPVIAPSLYEISNEVNKLKTVYEDKDYWRNTILSREFKTTVLNFYQELKTYFKNYSTLENEVEEANKLLTKFDEINKEYKHNYNFCVLKVFTLKIIIYLVVECYISKLVRGFRNNRRKKRRNML